MKIGRLPLDVANKIAAGEVVERPASVVKELVENSVDAGALNVAVEITGGGLDLIRVVDDGCGMDREDASLAFERHATSKIRNADELFHVNTLGFRGEALPSIASVSKMRLTTRESGSDAAWRVELESGIIIEQGPASGRKGTAVEVESLFFNTPARLKYLKSKLAEGRRVEQVMERLALANPGVSMKLSVDGSTGFESAGDGEPRSAARAVLGRAAEDMTEGRASSPGIEAYVLIAGPEQAKKKRQDQFIIVNGRPVSSAQLNIAIDRGLEGVQMHSPYPPAVIWLEIDPSRIDVNVHPAKAEVRFADESAVFSAVHHAVIDAVTSEDATLSIKGILSGDAFSGAAGADAEGAVQEVATAAGSVMKERYMGYFAQGAKPSGGWQLKPRAQAYGMPQDAPAGFAAPVPVTQDEALQGTQEGGQGAHPAVIGQFKNSYILAEKDGSLLVIDQHVAHERILVERFLKLLEDGSVQKQSLLISETVELMPGESAVLKQEAESLKALGFDVEPFGLRNAIIRAVPLVGGSEPAPEALLLAAIRDLAEERREAVDIGGKIRRAATEMACKGAVKAGMRLEREQMQDLLERLFRTSNPLRCPHGRPILLKVDLAGIERGVGRR